MLASGNVLDGLDVAVLDVDDALGPLGDVALVSHQQERVARRVEVVEQVEYLRAGVRVDVTGGLVGEYQRRVGR